MEQEKDKYFNFLCSKFESSVGTQPLSRAMEIFCSGLSGWTTPASELNLELATEPCQVRISISSFEKIAINF